MYKIIMLPQPILVSDEQAEVGEYDYSVNYKTVTLVDEERYKTLSLPAYKGMYKRVIAGIEGLPKLDLSLIADGIGWVDVEKLANDHIYSMQNRKLSPLILGAKKLSFIDGFKTHQSLNEKKYSEKDMRDAFIAGQDNIDCDGDCIDEVDTAFAEHIDSLSKLKEHQVEVEMERTRYPKGDDGWEDVYIPKITNNTIKILKLL